MAALATNQLNDTGIKPTFVAASASDTAEIGSGRDNFVVYRNTDTNIKTITIPVAGATTYGIANPPAVFSLPASTGELWIPLRSEHDNGAATIRTGRATLNVTGTGGVTGVSVSVVTH